MSEINVIIQSGAVEPGDVELVFGSEPVKVIDRDSVTDLPGLLAELGLYKSRSEARRAGRTGDIPTGYTEMKGSKKCYLFIWNPI
ncbi:hypothetical protein EniLVp02_0009 [Vibrio phage EniLVp02]